ncbi:uncharacterized protein MICPUCDRAFT_54310 [Micromonas pusilla CCMP1545]|uniref:Predicted protein n=1 Tax=Micromonas pusilla (strain CCMP1545) TaxID=564608 RepID=C1N903_MICPC|nr:uncharacterized protein MICPUCDRAFT_54310 [Micromonas pusilla CCMP1545]EEH51435.1 predicted protein [Micromonas pusilla CCMP1545]|eukprot:XP_003064530.1 predicted protein [Micromonas pusilla CCMP1545]
MSSRRPPAPSGPAGVRNAYASHVDGAAGHYRDAGASYANPHEPGVREMLRAAVEAWPTLWAPRGGGDDDALAADDGESNAETASVSVSSDRILDLSCGSGEVTLALRDAGVSVHRVDACDPYTSEAFARRVGAAVPFYPWSFEDIACGGVLEGRRWRVVVCSFAMHLCPPSYLRLLCAALAAATDELIVLTPHKNPHIPPEFGWTLAREAKARSIHWSPYDRVRVVNAVS